jgi:hypothetical protein
VAAIRGYRLSSEEVDFTDGNGNVTPVVVFDLSTDDFTDWWTFAATLVAVGPTVPPGS